MSRANKSRQLQHKEFFKNLKEAAHLIHTGEAKSPRQAAEIVHKRRSHHLKKEQAHEDWADAKKVLTKLPVHTTQSRNALAHLIHVADAAHEIDKAIKEEESKNPSNKGAAHRYKRVIKNLSKIVGTAKRNNRDRTTRRKNR